MNVLLQASREERRRPLSDLSLLTSRGMKLGRELSAAQPA